MIINDMKERCSYQNWYHNFNNLIDDSVIIQIPDDVLEYLRADGMVLPKEAVVERVPTYESNSESASNWDESVLDMNEIIPPSFPHFSQQLADAINTLGGSVFIKLNWSAPFDSAWIIPDKTLRCTTLEDIYLLLKSSERIDSDLSYEFKGQEFVTFNKHVIVLKRWIDMDPGTQYRCFVYENKLVAISQRHLVRAHGYITEAKFDIIEDIKKFYDEQVKDIFQFSTYVFDVIWKKKDDVNIIDISPLDHSTKSLLFGWDEIVTLANTSNAGGNLPEFRYLANNPGHQPVYYGVPLDFNPHFINKHSSVMNGMAGYFTVTGDDFLNHKTRNSGPEM